jgi:hypothetical protein
MTKTIEDLFIYTSVFSPLLPLVLFIIFWAKVKTLKPLQIIVIYLGIEFLTNIISWKLQSEQPKLVILYSFYTIAEYLLFAIFFYTIINNSKIRKTIIVASSVFCIFAIIYFLLVKYKFLDSVPIGVETILILTYAFYYLFEQMEPSSQTLIYQRYHFWLAAGIMIYLAGSFFIYIFANQVDDKTLNEYWVFQNGFTIVKNLLFGISILVYLNVSKRPNKKFLHI